MTTSALLGDVRIGDDEIGNTAVGMYRVLARTRAYWIDKHQLPDDTKPIVVIAPWLACAYGQPEPFLAGIRSLNIEPLVGDPRTE